MQIIEMDIEEYLQEKRLISSGINKLMAGSMSACPASPNETSCHYIDMNLAHFMGINSHKERIELTEKILANILTTKNIDHFPQYISCFCEHIEVIDKWNAMELEYPVILAGFHTGPYWSFLSELARRNRDMSIIFPKNLQSTRPDVLKVFSAVKNWHDSQSTLELLDTGAPDFFLAAKRAVREGRVLIVYIDANSGSSNNTARNVDIEFMRREISVSSSIFILAYILKAYVVSFNCRREKGMGRKLVFGQPLRVTDKEKSLHSVMQEIYSELTEFLSSDPLQWEGWLYAHKLLKQNNSCASGNVEWGTRYFVEEAGERKYVLDKSSMKIYAVRR